MLPFLGPAPLHYSGPHREFPALPEEVLLQILHPFADSIQHYAEEIAVYHPPALADDACKLTAGSPLPAPFRFGRFQIRAVRNCIFIRDIHVVRVAMFEDWRLPFINPFR